jgi:two-component system nitrogen regulation sensor histidine kinase NtrY
LIDQTVSLFRGLYAQIEIEAALDADLPASVPLDLEQFKRVLINILDNAIEAMSKKGKITVHAFYEKPMQRVNIAISDTGPGISVEDKTKLFLPYFSTEKRHGAGAGHRQPDHPRA